MPPTTITYRRTELYEQVWAQPMTHVAKKYGVSDVALAKTCRKLGIPMPGNGYWSKLRAGKKPRRQVLPPGKLEVIEVVRREPEPHRQLPPELEEKIARERDPALRIVVSDKPEKPNPLVWQDPRGRDWIGKDQRDRAVRVMNALVEALQARGVKVHDQFPERRYDDPLLPYMAVADFDGDRVVFGIHEMYEGVLRLLIVTRPDYEARFEQRDTNQHRIEVTLNRFVIQIYKIAAQVKRWRIIRAEQKIEEAARREREQKEREAQAEFEKLETELLRDVEGWRLARDIRTYVTQSLTTIQDAGAYPVQGGAIDAKLAWAIAYADRIDPINALRTEVREQLAEQGCSQTQVDGGAKV